MDTLVFLKLRSWMKIKPYLLSLVASWRAIWPQSPPYTLSLARFLIHLYQLRTTAETEPTIVLTNAVRMHGHSISRNVAALFVKTLRTKIGS